MKEIGMLIHMVDVKLKRKNDLLAAQYNLTSIQVVAMDPGTAKSFSGIWNGSWM